MKDYILVIDDSPTIRTSIEYSLKKLGFPVFHAENGQAGLDLISDAKKAGREIRLCICDINMPVMDGVSFVREFRKDDKLAPVIMLTTESGMEMVKMGKAAGASCWMVKPFKPDELTALVQKIAG